MHNNRNPLSALESYLDMIINVLMIYIAYFLTCLIKSEPTVYPNEPVTVVAILIMAIVTSFIYQAMNLYKDTFFSKSAHGSLKIVEALVKKCRLEVIEKPEIVDIRKI